MEHKNSSAPLPLQVDIVSDVVCPWCIIGYKQLMKALAALPGQFDVTLRWHPFELNPRMPGEGQDLREHLAQKYGTSPAQSQGARARLAALGESLGFTFDYFEGMRMVNTFRAHQLLHWAGEQGRQTELKLALFEAFFSRREDVNDPEVLAAVAGRAGLDSAQAGAVLSDARYASGGTAGATAVAGPGGPCGAHLLFPAAVHGPRCAGGRGLCPPVAEDSAQEARRRMSISVDDHIAIQRLMYRYARCADHKDYAGFAEVFCADAVFDFRAGWSRPCAAIQEMMHALESTPAPCTRCTIRCMRWRGTSPQGRPIAWHHTCSRTRAVRSRSTWELFTRIDCDAPPGAGVSNCENSTYSGRRLPDRPK